MTTPARCTLLRLAPDYRRQEHFGRRLHAERINLLSRKKVQLLFPKTWLRIKLAAFAVAWCVLRIGQRHFPQALTVSLGRRIVLTEPRKLASRG